MRQSHARISIMLVIIIIIMQIGNMEIITKELV